MKPELSGINSPIRAKRGRHLQADNIQGLTNHSIRRLARRGGIKRVKHSIYETVREIIEAKVREIIRVALQYTEHAGRKTVTSLDIVFALQKVPGIRTNEPLPIFPAGWHPVAPPKKTIKTAIPYDDPEPEPEVKEEVEPVMVKTDEGVDDAPVPDDRVVKHVRFKEDLVDEYIVESIEVDEPVDMDMDTGEGYEAEDDEDDDNDDENSREAPIDRILDWVTEVATAMDEEKPVKKEEN